VEDKRTLMRKLGNQAAAPRAAAAARGIPGPGRVRLELVGDGLRWSSPSTRSGRDRHRALLRRLHEHGIDFKDLQSSESSLEDIFVRLVREEA
jgi:ABC-2 type transport system ATP-binding protein